MTVKRGRPRVKKTTENAAGIARGAAALRDLVAIYSKAKRNKITERYVGGILHGYLGAVFKSRLRSEMAVPTSGGSGKGRPEQIDFAIGRVRQGGDWEPDSVIEFAVRRPGHTQGADPSGNMAEVSKLCRAKAKHRILLLLDLTESDYGPGLKKHYLGYTRSRGAPIKRASINVIYVGKHGVTKFKMPAQRLAPKKRAPKK
jgi:hypothetical protein